MNHPGDLLSAHLDGEVSAAERKIVEEHMATCETCREDVAALREARDAVRSLPMLEVPSVGFRRPRFFRPSLAWAASGVAAAALALGLAIAPGEDDATFDLDTVRDQHTARVVVDPGISTVRGQVGDP